MAEKNLEVMTYCGLCCPDCHGYKGKIPDLARDLRKELRSAQYDKFAAAIADVPFGKPFAHYDECYDLLGAMVKFRCRKGCRNGGGLPFCKIRKCCQEKAIAGCWECGDAEACKKLDFLKTGPWGSIPEKHSGDPEERHYRVHGRETELVNEKKTFIHFYHQVRDMTREVAVPGNTAHPA